MQRNLSSQSCFQRRYVRLGTVVTIACSLIVVAITISCIALSHGSENDKNITRGNDSYQASTELSTTILSARTTSINIDTETYISATLLPNHWIIDSHLIIDRRSFPAITIPNGEILVCGGYAPHGGTIPVVPFCEIYSSSNRKWRKVANMNVGRSHLTLTLLSNGKNILAVGSSNQLDGYTAEIYDIDMNKWFFVPNTMTTSREESTATLLRNGQILIVGGKQSLGSVLATSELYIPASGTFVTTGSLNSRRYGHTTILLNDGLSALIIGGGEPLSSLSIAPPEIYIAGSWYHTMGDMMTRRTDCAAVLLQNGNVLVAGGIDANLNTVSSVEIYKASIKTFSLVQPMACARSHFTLTLLPTGQVLAVGGRSSSTDECLRVTELYNPITDQWISTRLLNTARYNHNAVLINNSVLILGGIVDKHNYQYVCERYDL